MKVCVKCGCIVNAREDSPFGWCHNCKDRVVVKEMNDVVRVVEIFDSIIGEGRWIGRRATFLRLAGCNLRCKTCDTAYAWNGGKEYELGVLKYVLGNLVPKSGILIITGGEPLLQKDAVVELADLFRREYKVLLETNGTIHLSSKEVGKFTTITVSPKNGRIGYEDIKEWARYDNVDFKFVVGNARWCWAEQEIESMIKICGISKENVWLMPHTVVKEGETIMENDREVWEIVLRLGVNYSDRIHIRVWKGQKMR